MAFSESISFQNELPELPLDDPNKAQEVLQTYTKKLAQKNDADYEEKWYKEHGIRSYNGNGSLEENQIQKANSFVKESRKLRNEIFPLIVKKFKEIE